MTNPIALLVALEKFFRQILLENPDAVFLHFQELAHDAKGLTMQLTLGETNNPVVLSPATLDILYHLNYTLLAFGLSLQQDEGVACFRLEEKPIPEDEQLLESA